MKKRFEQMRIFPLPTLDVLERLTSRRNARLLTWLFLTLAGLVTFDTIAFHVIMDIEGQSHSWLTGVYWTFTTMTTLGLGDIVFYSDTGKVFTAFVLVSASSFSLSSSLSRYSSSFSLLRGFHASYPGQRVIMSSWSSTGRSPLQWSRN